MSISKDLIRTWKYRTINESTQEIRMTEQEKIETLEAVAKFNEYTQHVYKTNEIKDMVENIKKLAENASRMAIEETADWFDVVSVKRDTKAIGESVKVFESTLREISTLQQRMESVFEDIGSKLGKYYEIKELNETNLDAVGKEDGDIDNDGDEDKSDAYLTKKRAAISTAMKTEDSDYQEKFKDALQSAGVDSPADLDDEEKKEFFNKVDKMHKAKNESTIRLENMLRKLGNLENKAINEAIPRLASGLKALLQVGATITKNVGEDALIKLSDKFDRIDDEYAGDIASHLDMAIELMQDGYPGAATNKLKQFNKACKDVLNGKSIKSAFAEGIKEAGTTGFSTWTIQFAPQELSGVMLGGKTYSVTARTTTEAIKKAAASAGLKGNDWMAANISKLVKTK